MLSPDGLNNSHWLNKANNNVFQHPLIISIICTIPSPRTSLSAGKLLPEHHDVLSLEPLNQSTADDCLQYKPRDMASDFA
jgi:hypothetical protein